MSKQNRNADLSPSVNSPDTKPRLFFTSGGKTCLIRADGTGLRSLELEVPNQATWQPGSFLPDGRVMLLSIEPRRDGPGRFSGEVGWSPRLLADVSTVSLEHHGSLPRR